MAEDSHNRLFNLEAERDALRHASQTGSSLEGILARISAEVTKQSALGRSAEKPPHIIPIKAPEIDAKVNNNSWLDDKTFPFTPLESLYLLRGYAIRPSMPVSDDVLKQLPYTVQIRDGYLSIC